MAQPSFFEQHGVADIGALPGASGAHILDWLKNGYFSAKRYDAQKPWTLVSEYICADIASLLGLPIPARRFVPFQGQQWLGFEWRNDAKAFTAGMEQHLINKEVVSGMIAFDVWMCNRDRNTGNVLFQRPSPGVKQYTMSLIDHSHALIGDLPNIQVLYQHIQAQGDPKWFVGATPMELRSMVKTADDFEVWLKGIEELDMTQVRQAGEVLPKEWILNIEQYDELLQFIANRAREVRRLITANPNLFFFP